MSPWLVEALRKAGWLVHRVEDEPGLGKVELDALPLFTPEREDSAALLMKHLARRYVQYTNRACQRSGTL